MDAAQTFRKTALFFAVALLCAGSASAGVLTTSIGANPTVNLVPGISPSASFQVTSPTPGVNYTVVKQATNGGWFSVNEGVGTTPGQISVIRTGACSVNGVACGDGTFTIRNNSDSGDVITVTVHEGAGSGGTSTLLSANPNPITITAGNGFSNSAQLTLSSTSSTSLSVSVSTTPASSWLSVFPSSGAVVSNGSPATFQIAANSSALNPNTTYSGTVSFTPAGGSALNVPVSFVVGTGSTTTGTIVVSPNFVNLAYPTGTSSALVGVASTTAVSYTAQSDSTWLLVNGAYVTTQNVGVNLGLSLNGIAASGLSTGTYTGHVTVYNAANASDNSQVTVTLAVNGATGGGTSSGVFASPTTLNFAYQPGGPTPLCQAVLVTSTDSYSVSSSGRFFANVQALTGPGSFNVCVTTFNASAGTSNGSVTITSTTNGSSQSIAANLLVADASAPVVTATVNSNFGDLICTAQTGCTATVSVAASDNSFVPITVTPSNTWIVLGSSPTSTPATFSVQLNPSGISGLNTGNISIAATGAANSPVVIPVVFGLGGSTTSGGNLTLSSSSFTFNAAGTQNLTVSGPTSGTAFNASVSGSNCGWLSISPSGSLTTTNTITLTAILSGVTAGTTYTCNINLVSGGVTQAVPVTFTPGGGGSTGSLAVSPTSLNFTTQKGVAPAAQTLHITSTSGAVSFSASRSDNAPWLSVNPSGGTTPGDLTISVSPGTLEPGSYIGYVVIPGLQLIPVNLTITAATGVTATPTSLSFTYVAGTSNPTPLKISVTGAAANLPFFATVTSGADWLSVSPATGVTAATAVDLSVSVNPSSLQANKTYTGTIVVAGSGSATGSTTINVTLAISAPLPTITRVTNAASFNSGSISAGEIITLFGNGIGPATLTTPATPGTFPTDLAGVTVTVGGYLAPLIYVRGDQISAIVPYEINRPIFLANVPVIVRFLGQSSNGVNVTQASAAPGIFTTGGGSGQSAALNQNLSVNSFSNAAGKGEVVVLYVTGEGQTNPAGVTGKITANTGIPTPISGQVTVTIGGQPAQVLFAGEAPGLVSGVMQVNVIVPTTLTNTTVTDQPVVVSVGGVSSQTNANGVGTATVAVR
jgi:trimeric autotransporter adhesin